MADLAYRKLTEQEIAEALSEANHWTREGNEIVRTLEFDSYLAGVETAAKIAHLAEALDHHPDMLIGYRKLTIRVSTHSVKGLSPYDFELARQIEATL